MRKGKEKRIERVWRGDCERTLSPAERSSVELGWTAFMWSHYVMWQQPSRQSGGRGDAGSGCKCEERVHGQVMSHWPQLMLYNTTASLRQYWLENHYTGHWSCQSHSVRPKPRHDTALCRFDNIYNVTVGKWCIIVEPQVNGPLLTA